MHYYNGKIIRGCVNGVFDKETLANSITERAGRKGFILPGVCLESTKKDFFTNKEVFYEFVDFYALEINDNNVIDIRDNVLKNIGIN